MQSSVNKDCQCTGCGCLLCVPTCSSLLCSMRLNAHDLVMTHAHLLPYTLSPEPHTPRVPG